MNHTHLIRKPVDGQNWDSGFIYFTGRHRCGAPVWSARKRDAARYDGQTARRLAFTILGAHCWGA